MPVVHLNELFKNWLLNFAALLLFIMFGIVIAATTPIIPSVIRTSASVKPIFHLSHFLLTYFNNIHDL